jgi:hypothetical protein
MKRSASVMLWIADLVVWATVALLAFLRYPSDVLVIMVGAGMFLLALVAFGRKVDKISFGKDGFSIEDVKEKKED